MTQVRKASRTLGVVALALLAVAFVAFVVPVVKFARADFDDGVSVGFEPVTVYAPGDRTWGLYFYDPDNSGYSASCLVTDPEGGLLELRDPGVNISSYEFETLDQQFTTPAGGAFIVTCTADGSMVRVAPVGDLRAVLIGVTVGAVLGLAGTVLGSLWLVRRRRTPTQAAAGSPQA